MIYSGVVNYNGYRYECDKPEDFRHIELLVNIQVPIFIKYWEPIAQRIYEDIMIYGTGVVGGLGSLLTEPEKVRHIPLNEIYIYNCEDRKYKIKQPKRKRDWQHRYPWEK